MTVKHYMNQDMRLRKGILSLPAEKGVPPGRQVAYLDKTTLSKFLLIVPGLIADVDLDLWALSFLGITPRLGDLEAELKGSRVKMKIPTIYLSNVNLYPNSGVRVVRYTTEPSRDQTEVWRRADFRAYERSVSWNEINESGMRLGL